MDVGESAIVGPKAAEERGNGEGISLLPFPKGVNRRGGAFS